MLAESENYAINSCKITNDNLLIRKSDNAICYLSDSDANMLTEMVDDFIVFDTICASYSFMNSMLEKSQ